MYLILLTGPIKIRIKDIASIESLLGTKANLDPEYVHKCTVNNYISLGFIITNYICVKFGSRFVHFMSTIYR